MARSAYFKGMLDPSAGYSDGRSRTIELMNCPFDAEVRALGTGRGRAWATAHLTHGPCRAPRPLPPSRRPAGRLGSCHLPV